MRRFVYRQKPCHCNTTWCKDMRQRSLHRITTFKFPNEVIEQQLWLKAALGINGSAAKINVPSSVQSLRASAVHFFAEDLLHNKSGGIRLRKENEMDGRNYGRYDPCSKMGPLPRATEPPTPWEWRLRSRRRAAAMEFADCQWRKIYTTYPCQSLRFHSLKQNIGAYWRMKS